MKHIGLNVTLTSFLCSTFPILHYTEDIMHVLSQRLQFWSKMQTVYSIAFFAMALLAMWTYCRLKFGFNLRGGGGPRAATALLRDTLVLVIAAFLHQPQFISFKFYTVAKSASSLLFSIPILVTEVPPQLDPSFSSSSSSENTTQGWALSCCFRDCMRLAKCGLLLCTATPS